MNKMNKSGRIGRINMEEMTKLEKTNEHLTVFDILDKANTRIIREYPEETETVEDYKAKLLYQLRRNLDCYKEMVKNNQIQLAKTKVEQATRTRVDRFYKGIIDGMEGTIKYVQGDEDTIY